MFYYYIYRTNGAWLYGHSLDDLNGLVNTLSRLTYVDYSYFPRFVEDSGD